MLLIGIWHFHFRVPETFEHWWCEVVNRTKSVLTYLIHAGIDDIPQRLLSHKVHSAAA